MITRPFGKLALLSFYTHLAIAAPAFAGQTNAVPEKFTASIGGFLGATYGVELQDGNLLYSAAYAPRKTTSIKITPTAQQWREFRRALDEISIWQWQTNYPNPGGIYDGTQWALEIKYQDRTLRTQGNNNFP